MGTHSFYLPIVMGAWWFGHLGAALTSVSAAILAGPLMPFDAAGGVTQASLLLAVRTVFFLLVGQLVAWLAGRRGRAERALERNRELVSSLNARLAGDQMRELQRDLWSDRIQGVIDDPSKIRVVLQPLVHLPSQSTVGVEGLSRFEDESVRGPEEWFSEAWAVNLGAELEITALRRAAELIDSLEQDTLMSVNVSPETFVSQAFDELLADLPVHRMVFELTEHARVVDYARIKGVTKRIRAVGGRVAIDDAGAGYSTFRHILELRPDIIKLDVRLIRRIDSDEALRLLARSFCELAHGLDAELVAEGIETKEELEVLTTIGVEFGQGFHLGRPKEPITIDLLGSEPSLP
jgi:EAL domain-containing protein (putative c-di-GMP-specific phosphodiesterase class I)